MIVSIHQPEYIPWLGFFDKMRQCDVFVLLDTVQYKKDNFQNRNRIRVKDNNDGWIWLTVPLVKGPYSQTIDVVQISNATNWRRRHWRLLELWYGKAPFFSRYKEVLQDIYDKEWSSISKLNIELIFTIRDLFGINTKLLVASDLGLDNKGKGGTEVNFNICVYLGASVYLSGKFGRDYLDETPFLDKTIVVKYQDFHHPVYNQMLSPFIPNMSSMDLLFNEGDQALNIIREANSQ